MDDPEESAVHLPSGTTNLAELLARRARLSPDAVALVEPGSERRTRTWAQLDDQVERVAAGLAAHGLVAGHRVGLIGPNSIEFIVAYLATLRAGFVAVPMNPQSSPREIAAMIEDAGVRVLFAADGLAGSGAERIPLSDEGLAALAADGTAPVSSPEDPESLAVLLFTAGTSGRPKAAMLSHRALLAHLEHVAALEFVDEQTTVLAMLPLFHVFGLNAVLGSWLHSGAKLVVSAAADGLARLIAAEQVTNLPLAPVVLQALLDDDAALDALGSLTTVVSGAAPLSAELREAFSRRTGLRVEQGYGLTEAAPGVTATLGGPLLGHGHVGRPLPGVEVRIGDGTEPAEPGEIWIRGDNLFSGYWPDGHGGADPDGWFATGDIGYLADGELFLVDRSRELVTVNGFNVYPAEIEEAIGELAGVEAVAVVGRPDPRTGEQVVAFVIGSGLTVDAVAAHCAQRLAKFKRPGVIRLLDQLPRGATGKVQKGVLRSSLDETGQR